MTQTISDWAEKEYQKGLDRLAGEEEEVVKLQEVDPDDYQNNLENR
jgi:hypothetical protein